MPIISITQYIDRLYEYLTGFFDDYHGIAAKSNDEPFGGEFLNKPYIYRYLMPSCDLCGQYPSKSPCIVITVDSQDDNTTYSITLHLCVKYDAISEAEKARPIPGAVGAYEFVESDDYNTNADVELYKESLIFTELLTSVLYKNQGLSISDVTSELPDPTLPDHPYCVSSISFKAKVNVAEVNVKAAYDSFY